MCAGHPYSSSSTSPCTRRSPKVHWAATNPQARYRRRRVSVLGASFAKLIITAPLHCTAVCLPTLCAWYRMPRACTRFTSLPSVLLNRSCTRTMFVRCICITPCSFTTPLSLIVVTLFDKEQSQGRRSFQSLPLGGRFLNARERTHDGHCERLTRILVRQPGALGLTGPSDSLLLLRVPSHIY